MSTAQDRDWRLMLDEAVQALTDGHHHDALQLCDRAAVMGNEARYHAAILRGDTLLDLGDPGGALSSYETAADPDRQDAELDCARGVALFELGKLAEAENALMSALRGKADLAEAYFTLGLIAELRGTGQEVEYFRRARRLDGEKFPTHPFLSREAFEHAVDQAIVALPPVMQKTLTKVPLLIAELPHPDDVEFAEGPLSPFTLGFYMGPPPDQSDMMMQASDVIQPAMVLFKRNLERAAATPVELVREIRATILDELGVALGYSEAEINQALAVAEVGDGGDEE